MIIVFFGFGSSELGIVGAHWKHDVIQKALAIEMAVTTLQQKISDSTILDKLKRIKDYANLIKKAAPELPSEDAEEPVIIEELLDRVIKKYTSSQKDIKVNLLSEKLPFIFANNAWLSVAFEQPINNAVREMSDGGELTIICESSVSKLFIRIKDTGHGIPDKIKSQIFKRGVTEAKGSGLGLLLTKTILLKYGGNIKLESTCPKGTTFTIELPIQPPKK